MKIEEIIELIGNQKYDNEQISLPVVNKQNGKEFVSFFTFNSHDVSEDTMVITEIDRKFNFDLESNAVFIDNVNNQTERTIKFDNVLSLDELDELYKNYYNAIDENLAGNLDVQQLNEVLKKLVPQSMINIFEELNVCEKADVVEEEKEVEQVQEEETDEKEEQQLREREKSK